MGHARRSIRSNPSRSRRSRLARSSRRVTGGTGGVRAAVQPFALWSCSAASQKSVRAKSMIVVWRITQRCNLSCPFCAYDRKSSWPRREADASVVRRFGAVLAEYQRATGDGVLVSWIGGEPFLFPQLSELTVLFTQELGLRLSATTNGTTLGSAAMRAHILAHYTELTVSVDGIGAVHDGLRGWRGGYEALRVAVVQLAETKLKDQHGPRLRANVVLMRQTIADFE